MGKNISNDFTSEMRYGFGFMQIQNDDPFQNFMKKIEVDETNEKVTMTFTKLANSPIVIDFRNKKLTLPSNREKNFDKFLTVTFEYCREDRTVIVKTFRYYKGKFEKACKRLSIDDLKHVKPTNFLNIYSDNYFKTSKKLIENDSDYMFPIPDFYKLCVSHS
jgi:hypothetical protein